MTDTETTAGGVTKSPLDLLDLPYAFTQLPSLTPDAFKKEAQARGVTVSIAELEALHQLRLLTPLLRVKRHILSPA